MTKINDQIRQASLFTMNGLPDPRMMPGYSFAEANESEKNNWLNKIQQSAEHFIMKHFVSMKIKN